jgi:septal ring factor EnvC (AmiA/AmiB activator)
MPPVVERTAQRIADNPTLTAAARILNFITPLLLSVAIAVAGWYLAGQATAAQTIDTRVTSVERGMAATDTDVRVLQSQLPGVVAQVSALSDKVDKFADKSSDLLAAISALNARLDEADRAANRRP